MALRPSLLTVALVGALLAAPQSQQDEHGDAIPVKLVDGGQSVELAIDGFSVAEFLAFAQPILGVPVHSQPDEVVPTTLHQLGTQRVARKDFRDVFEALLRREGFFTWDDGDDAAPVIVVRKAWIGSLYPKPAFTPPVITLEELASGPRRRSPFYTVTFPLTHIDARAQLVATMFMFDSALESVRHVEGANALVVSASREHLLALRDLLVQIDVTGPEPVGVARQVSELEMHLAQIDKRLTALEKSKAGG